jgi:hypothetical protein
MKNNFHFSVKRKGKVGGGDCCKLEIIISRLISLYEAGQSHFDSSVADCQCNDRGGPKPLDTSLADCRCV